jgi:hypothetical protein
MLGSGIRCNFFICTNLQKCWAGALPSSHHVHIHVGHRNLDHILVGVVVVVIVVVVVVVIVVVVVAVDDVEDGGRGKDGERHEIQVVRSPAARAPS